MATKWTLTDACAKRVVTAYAEAIYEERGCGVNQYASLKSCMDAEQTRGHDRMGLILQWIARNRPELMGLLVADLAGRYERLRRSATGFLDAFDGLSTELSYDHFHNHDDD